MSTVRRSSERRVGALYDYEGRLNQAVAGDFVSIPWHLELRDRGLLYAYFDPRVLQKRPTVRQFTLKDLLDAKQMHRLGLSHLKSPNPRVLDGFVNLAEAPDERILEFAQRWGVLDLCKHGLPTTHLVGQLRWGIPASTGCDLVKPPDTRFPGWAHYGFETCEWWRGWAARARGLLRVSAALKSFRRGAPEDWKSVASFGREGLPRPRLSDDVMAEWRLLSEYVNGWCELANVAPYLVPRRDGMLVRFGSRTLGQLFGTIGLQMLARISQIGSMALCASCSEIYKPKRLPHPGRLNFCEDCGRAAAVRMAKQRESLRKLRAHELNEQGKSVTEIAREIGSEISTARRWLRPQAQRPK